MEKERKGMKATKVAGLDGRRVLGSLHSLERRTTYTLSPQRQQQQVDIVSICTKTAVALTAEGLGRLSDLLQDIFRRNGLPLIAISPHLHHKKTMENAG